MFAQGFGLAGADDQLQLRQGRRAWRRLGIRIIGSERGTRGQPAAGADRIAPRASSGKKRSGTESIAA